LAQASRNPAPGESLIGRIFTAAAGAFHPHAQGRGIMMPHSRGKLMILIPAFNEEGAVGGVVDGVKQAMPGVPVLVVDDCSSDATLAIARAAKADVLALPHHLGLGGCVQAGYKLAFELGYQYVIRVDGDGQHDARDIPKVFETLLASGCEMVIGSRYLNGTGESTSLLRAAGIRFFRMVLRPILGKPVRDPTSGFVGVNRSALEVFSRSFPLEYPEIEALVVLQRRRFRFVEVPCRTLPRRTGRSSITPMKSIYYIVHVLLGVFVNVLKYERRIPRESRRS
jgi:glycosyltransferase involved in cell wall biosynthesis